MLEVDDVEGEPIRPRVLRGSRNSGGCGNVGSVVVRDDRDGHEGEKNGAEGEEDSTVHPSRECRHRRSILVCSTIKDYSPFRGKERIVIGDAVERCCKHFTIERLNERAKMFESFSTVER